MPLDHITGQEEPDAHGYYESETSGVVGRHEHPAENDDLTSGDGSYTSKIKQFHTDFQGSIQGRDTMFVVEEIFDWFAENGLMSGVKKGQETESHWRTVANKLIKSFYYISQPRKLKVATTYQISLYAVLHAWDMPEFDAINGNLNMAQFAKTIIVKYRVGKGGKRTPVYLTKAAVNNAVLDVQKHFQLQPRRDQRKEASKQAMSETRKGQLKPQNI